MTEGLRNRAGVVRDYAALLNLTHDSIFVCDMSGRILFWNRGAEETYGWSERETLGEVVYVLLATEFPKPLEQIEADLLATGRWEGELVHRKRDGTHIVVASRWALQRDAQGVPVEILETSNDITPRKRAEDVLRDSEQRYRAVIETAHEAFIAMDAAGRIIDWNRQAELTFGWPRAEAIGRPLAEMIIPPQYRESHRRGLQHFLATRQGPVLNKRIELTALHRDGREFPVELTIAAIRLGPTYIFNSFLHDITERKQAEDALQRQKAELTRSNAELAVANKELEAFTYSVSHDLRAPLRHIGGFSRILAEEFGPRTDPRAQRCLQRIQKGVQEMGQLIDDLVGRRKRPDPELPARTR